MKVKHDQSRPIEPGSDASGCLETFGDLVAAGFPLSPELDPPPRGYTLAYERFRKSLAAVPNGSVEVFDRFAARIREIRGNDIVWNPLFGKIKLAMLNIPAWQSAFSRRVVREWIDGLRNERAGELGIDEEARQTLGSGSEVITFLEMMAGLADEACSTSP